MFAAPVTAQDRPAAAALTAAFVSISEADWPEATIVAFDMIDKLVSERESEEFHQNPYLPSSS